MTTSPTALRVLYWERKTKGGRLLCFASWHRGYGVERRVAASLIESSTQRVLAARRRTRIYTFGVRCLMNLVAEVESAKEILMRHPRSGARPPRRSQFSAARPYTPSDDAARLVWSLRFVRFFEGSIQFDHCFRRIVIYRSHRGRNRHISTSCLCHSSKESPPPKPPPYENLS